MSFSAKWTDTVSRSGGILYQDVSRQALLNACESIYTYTVPEGLRDYRNPVMFWMGEHEPYPKKSAQILKEYAKGMRAFLEKS